MIIKPNTSNKLIVAFKDPQALAAFNVPQANGEIRTPTHHQIAAILQASNASLVASQCTNKLTG